MSSHHEAEKLVIIARFPYEAEAAPLMEALAAANITATMTGGFTAGFIAEAPGDIQIKILDHDLPRAKKVVAAFELGKHDVDWDSVDVGEPEDGGEA
jgi:hypothetical protein